MADLLGGLSLALVAVGILLGFLALLSTRAPTTGLTVLLDLLLAAGLLRLALADTWTAIATAAAVVAVRKLAATALAVAGRSLHRDRAATLAGRTS